MPLSAGDLLALIDKKRKERKRKKEKVYYIIRIKFLIELIC